MVALLWAAAIYRLVLSARSAKTVWRSAFTTCIVAVAVAATLTAWGSQTLDRWAGRWNLSLLLSHLALVVAAMGASIYVATLKRTVVPAGVVAVRVAAATVICVVEVVTWVAAPLHGPGLVESSEATSTTGCVFAVVFAATIVVATVETGFFSLSQASSRDDLTRTISLSMSGSACIAGAALFSLVGGAIVVRRLTGADISGIKAFLAAAVPWVLVVLAFGTLSLLVAPPLVEFGRHYRRWRSLRPLWQQMIRLRPEVHLDVPLTGDPVQRLRLRSQRAAVEIQDAMRMTTVTVPAQADLVDLARALRRDGGPRLASEVFAGTTGPADAKADKLVQLAHSYARNR